MATRSLGTLTLDLIAKIGGFTSGMDQASRVADKRMREIEKRANAFGRTIGSSIKHVAGEFLAFAGVTVTIGAAFESLKGAIDLADETRDLSIRLGVSTKAISDLRYAAQQTGTDMDTLSKGMKILAKNADLALNPTSAQAKIFKALGISVTDASGNLKNLADLVPEIADKFKGLEDGTTKAALAQALFGKSGLDLTEFLNSGKAGLTDYATKLRELGGEITPEAAANADAFNDKLADLKTAFGGVALQVASALLPALNELVDKLIGFTKDGANAKTVADDIADGFRGMAAAAKDLGQIIGFMQQLHDLLSDSDKFAQGLLGGVKGVGAIGDYLKRQFPWLYTSAFKNQDAPHQQASTFTGPSSLQVGVLNGQQSFNATAGQFSMVPRKTATTPATDSRALALALSNPSATKAHGGKSDAEREAEKVARAIEQMTKAQQDWEAEVSKTGNPIADEYADRLRQITEEAQGFAKDGVPAEKVKAFTDEMTKLATSLWDSDIVKFQKEFDDQTAEMAAQMQGPAAEALQRYKEDVAKLDDELKAGAITITEYNARLAVLGEVRDDPMVQVNKSIEEQIRLLGMTSDQQEIYNNLKQAGVDANSDWGQSIIANTEQLQKLREQTAFLDDVKSSLSDAFTDFITGAKSAKDAFGDFADHIYQTAIKWLADKAIQSLFNSFNSNGVSNGYGGGGGGSGGGFWASLIGAFASSSGGGRAGGGTVMPGKFYEVGEYDRPEMLMSRGKQYLIPGNHGSVVPMSSGATTRAGNTVNNYFSMSKRNDNRSERQVAQATGRAIRMA